MLLDKSDQNSAIQFEKNEVIDPDYKPYSMVVLSQDLSLCLLLDADKFVKHDILFF